jgi:hypothetical protein
MSIDLHSISIERHHIQFKLGELILSANGLVLKIDKKINDHTRVYFEVPIDSPSGDERTKAAYMEKIMAIEEVTINLVGIPGTKDQDGKEQPFNFFSGIITKLSLDVINNEYRLKGNALSKTYQMDIEKRIHSFQNKDMTYAQLLEKVTAKYGQKVYQSHVNEKQNVIVMALQYLETDWEFLCRMASRIYAGLIPNDANSGVLFRLGMTTDKKTYFLNENCYQNYEVKRNSLQYRQLAAAKTINTVTEADFLLYQINKTNQYLNLGDDVKFQKPGAEKEKNKYKSKELNSFIYTYTLTPEEAFKQVKFYNPQIRGVSLTGKVLEVSSDKVKVHFNAYDVTQPVTEAAWLPYVTAYSAEKNTGWYWMPEKGDYVNVYFPTHKENQAVVTGSIRLLTGSKDFLDNHQVKYLRTAHGKEIRFSENEVLISGYGQNDGGQIVMIKMNEKDGITIASANGNVMLYAKEGLTVTSAHDLKISAGNTLQVFSQTNSLEMDGATNLKGLSKIN